MLVMGEILIVKILRTVSCAVGSLLVLIGLVSAIFFSLGYRPIISADSRPDWEAIGAFGECVGVLVALGIPFAVLYLDKRIKSSIENSQARITSEIKNDTNEKLIALKAEYDEKLHNSWYCPHCHKVTEHSGIMCTNCGFRDCDN